jgi:uncharacterized protein
LLEATMRRSSDGDEGPAAGLLSRRAFLFGTAAVALEPPFEPPLPQRRRLRVAVIGDSVAQDLWFGLAEATPKNAHYVFIQNGKPSTGLTQPSFFDWPSKARELAQENWGAVLMLLGLNDNLPIKMENKWIEVGEPGWRAAYASRACDVTRAFTGRRIPLAWIGPPCVRPKSMDRGMLLIHEVLAEQVPEAGGVFISSRELTAGPDREFLASAPNASGKTVQLRRSDGVHFSNDGNRYLAAGVLGALRCDIRTARIFS